MPTNNQLKVICPFCNAEQSAEIMHEMESISEGCDTCGYGEEASGIVIVNCESCKRVIYKKEFTM